MSKLLGRWMRAHGQLNSEMPLRQYFLLVPALPAMLRGFQDAIAM
jgi:hypothetical protein